MITSGELFPLNGNAAPGHLAVPGLFRLFEGHEFVFAGACTDFLGIFEVPRAALRDDTLDKVDFHRLRRGFPLLRHP